MDDPLLNREPAGSPSAASSRPRLGPFWRIPLTVAGMFGMVLCGLGASLAVAPFSPPHALTQTIVPGAMTVGAVLIAFGLWRFVDRRPRSEMGLRIGRRAPLDLGVGVVAAVAVVVVIQLVNVALGFDRWRPLDLGLGTVAGLAVILLGQAIPEEVLWRGYLFTSLRAQWPRWATVIAVAAGFGLPHVVSNPGMDASLPWRLLYAVMAIGFGLALAGCRDLTGDVWLAVGFHAGHNLAASSLSGVYGPRLIVHFAALAGAGCLLLWLARRRRGR